MEERRDFLSYILKNRGEEGGITDKEVAANCGSLIIAGSETIATAMSGTTYHLLKNATDLQTMAKEIRDAFSSEAEVEVNFINPSNRLPFTMACISEGMRIYPPGPHSRNHDEYQCLSSTGLG